MLRASFAGPTEVPDDQQYYYPYDTRNDEYGQWDGEGYFFTKAVTADENPDEARSKLEAQPIAEENEVQEKPIDKVRPTEAPIKPPPPPPFPHSAEPEDEGATKEDPLVESEEESEEEVEVVPPEIRLKQRNRRRLALIFGNNDYSPPHQLHSCCKDAEDMATKLKGLGFDCTVVLNSKQRTMLYNEKRFSEKIRSGDCVLFYYSGHAMEDKVTMLFTHPL